MSEGYTVDSFNDEIAGIVVRQQGERGFRFHSSNRVFDALDGQVFVTPAAAQHAVDLFASNRGQRLQHRRYGG